MNSQQQTSPTKISASDKLKDDAIMETEFVNHTHVIQPHLKNTFNGVTLVYRASDGYVDATILCKASMENNKRVVDWMRLKRTKEFLTELGIGVGIPTPELVILGHSNNFGKDSEHTWVHRKVAYDIATWLSLKFAFQVHNWLDELERNEKRTNSILVIGGYSVIYRAEDGYVDATVLCQAGNKHLKHWLENKRTKEFMKVLEFEVGIPTSELIIFGDNAIHEHTFVHPQIAISIAQWICPEFDVKVTKWIYELGVTGKVELENEKTIAQLDQMHKQQMLTLETQLSNKQYELDNYSVVNFKRDELLRHENLSELASNLNIKHADIFNTCYVRVLTGTYDIDDNHKDVIVYKFGKSNTISKRDNQQKKYEYKNSKLIGLFTVVNSNIVEDLFKQFLDEHGLRIKTKIPNTTHNHRELFHTRPDMNINKVINMLQIISNQHHPISVQESKIKQLETTLQNTLDKLNICIRDKQQIIHDNEQRESKYHESELKHASDTATITQLRIEIEDLKNIISDINKRPVTVNNTIDQPINIENNIQVTQPETVTPNARKRICVSCDVPYNFEEFPKYKSGITSFECNNCLIKNNYVLDISKEHKQCVVCYIDKTMDEYTYGRNTCKQCSALLNKHKLRVAKLADFIEKYRVRQLESNGIRICTGCSEEKPHSDYNRKGEDRLESLCRDCSKKKYNETFKNVDENGIDVGRFWYIKDGVKSDTFPSMTTMSEHLNICRKTVRKYLTLNKPYTNIFFYKR